MTLKNQIRAWLFFFGATVLLLWLFRGILLPFVAGMALAYLLDPAADLLEKWKINRLFASLLILTIVIVLFLSLVVVVAPLVVNQIIDLIQRFPGYVEQLQGLFNEWAPVIYEKLGAERSVQVQSTLEQMVSNAAGMLGGLSARVMQSGLAIVNALSLLVVTPVVAFYLLLDWDRMVASTQKLLPLDHREEIIGVFVDIDAAMSGVIRGQGSVIVLLSIFYAGGLALTGLNFGLGIGVIAGVLSFVPYVGALVGGLLAIGVAIVQFGFGDLMMWLVLVIFLAGQFLEGNVLYPKLVGESIGVHPVWLMFALFAFAFLFGAVGALLAVPMAAIAGVIIRFAVAKYKASKLYLGETGGVRDDEPISQ